MDHYYHRMKNFTENRKKKKIILPLIFQTFFLLIRFKEKLLIWISKKKFYFSFFCLNVIAFTFYLINYSFVSPLFASWRFKWVHANSTVEFLKPEGDEWKGRKKSHLVYTFLASVKMKREEEEKNVLSLFKFSEVFLSLTFGKSAVKKEKSRNWNL